MFKTILVPVDLGEVEAAHLEMLQRLALAAEFRDDDTGQHTRRVGDLRVGRFRAGLGDGDIHQEPQTLCEVFGRSLALVFGHDGDPLPFATGKASM